MKTVAIIGFGNMGRAIGAVLGDSYQIIGLDQGDELEQVRAADFVILAVKPQVFDEVSEQLRPFLQNQVVISIMAGIHCERISRQLNIKSLVRTMPNLGVGKGASVTAAYINGQADKTAVSDLLKLWGVTIWLDKESDFDGFTAIAGCGPAYFFELTRQLQVAAEEMGFSQELSRQMANGILTSAAAVLGEDSAAEKVQQVASKGGATEAALQIMQEQGLGGIINQAVQAARDRSEELSK